MKATLGVVLGIVLAGLIISFLGLGFGLGGLAAAPVNANSSYFPMWSNDSSGSGGAIEPDVWIGMGTIPFVSSLQPGLPSTVLSVGVQVKSNGNCGGAGDPAWAGAGSSPGYYVISFSGGSTSYTIGSFGSPAPNLAAGTYNATALVVSFNNTNNAGSNNPDLFWCFQNGQITGGGGNLQSTNFNSVIFGFTLTVNNQASGTLSIVFHAGGSLCSGSPSRGANGDCASADKAIQGGTGTFANSGSIWSTASSVSVPLMNAQANVRTVGDGPWFNGGNIQFLATTGFGGPNGYKLSIQTPSARSGGGGLASGWLPSNPITLSNNLPSGSVVQETIPLGASQNCTANGCNQFTAVLTASDAFVNGQLSFPVDISPQYAPAQPTISDTNSAGTAYPSAGNTVTLTFTSTTAGTNQTPSAFLIQVFYLLPTQSVDQSQSCGQQWVTTPPCHAISVPATSAGGGSYTATYTFTVNPPLTTNAIGVVAQAVSVNQQSSAVTRTTISIAPTNCPPGTNCNPGSASLALWQIIGPILLSAIILVISALGAIFLPGVSRFLAVGLGVGTVALFYLLGIFKVLFAKGGPL